MTSHDLPVLYIVDKNGYDRCWSVSVISDTTIKKYGRVDGKMIIVTRTFKGVNIGRKNETSSEEQAMIQARRDWVSHIDKSYRPKCKEGLEMYKEVVESKAEAGGTNHKANFLGNEQTRKSPKVLSSADNKCAPSVEKQVLPMKCQVWELDDNGSVLPKIKKHFDFESGVYVQAKLDGVRCTSTVQEDGSVVMLSNSSKQFVWHSTLRKSIKNILKNKSITLDGELYSHSIINKDGVELSKEECFGIITSSCRSVRSNPSIYEDQMRYYVFDIIDSSLNQDERFKILDDLFDDWEDSRIVRVPSEIVTSEDEICEYHDKMAYEGYEGVIIRDRSLMYKEKHRSLKMRKYKNFKDEEFKVIGVELDEGVSREYFVWKCVTSDGKEFKSKPEGTREMKYFWYDNSEKYINRMITIKYQDLSPDGIPRFPIAKAFRSGGDLSLKI